MLRYYPAFVYKDKEYGITFPDFPGCVTAGATLEEAHRMAEEALQGHIEVELEYGEELPDPTPLEKANKLAKKERGVLSIVSISVRIPGYAKTKRINITIDEDLLKDIDAAAAKRGLSRSALLAQGARTMIRGK
jgi:predicted RNase H-like HicB family nuclease